MIYVDSRAGSKELAPLLHARGMPVTLTRMEYGDVSWLGQGMDGEPVSVGVEYKTIHDVIRCMCDGRFAGHQLPGLVQAYDLAYLLVEGLWRPNSKTGILEYRKSRGEWAEVHSGSRRFMYRDLVTWLSTAEIKGGIRSWRVSDLSEASIWISTQYRWWSENGGWESHKSHLAFHDGTRFGYNYRRERAAQMVNGLSDRALLQRPSLCRMVAAQLPGIGWEKSAPIAKRYRTVEALTDATVEELQELKGIGPKLAQGIYNSLRDSK